MSGKKWVLLIAGSNGWENYQHQANVCCFYKIIKKHGIPDEQIVTMMYDDIAYHSQNPHQGVISGVLDNSNLYDGIQKDYTGNDVTPENFLAALQGDVTVKKAIKSGKDDNIYIYMSGLGTNGNFQFPQKSLQTKEFNEAINNMTQNNKFSKMVIFVDSSYSATLFDGHLSTNEKVFVLTSCSNDTANVPTDYDENRKVHCSDKFSSHWFRFLSTADFTKETFHGLINQKQSKYFKENSVCSCQFGKLDVKQHYLSEFLQQ